MKILLLLLFPTLSLLGQDKLYHIHYYWTEGKKTAAPSLHPSTFYLTLHHESIENNSKKLEVDQALKQHLKDYDFTIEHQGFADDHIGFVFFRKLVFKKPPISSKDIQKLYLAVYSFDKIQFFGPLVANIYSEPYCSGAGLLNELGLQFKPDLKQEQMDALLQKYKLESTGQFVYNKEINRKIVNGTQYTTYQHIVLLDVRPQQFYGLALIQLATQLQQDPLIDKVSNRLFIQQTP